MTRALVIVFIQRDYVPGGECPLVGSDAAAADGETVVVKADSLC